MFKPISHLVNWNERRLTPAGTKVFGGTSNRSPSTSLKTPQEVVFLPRRLKPCARKAAACSASQRFHPEMDPPNFFFYLHNYNFKVQNRSHLLLNRTIIKSIPQTLYILSISLFYFIKLLLFLLLLF